MGIRLKIILEGFDPSRDGAETEILITLVNSKPRQAHALVKGPRPEELDISYRIEGENGRVQTSSSPLKD